MCVRGEEEHVVEGRHRRRRDAQRGRRRKRSQMRRGKRCSFGSLQKKDFTNDKNLI
ncbi:uncharacterized protein DS421_10g288170 [Arachis hypogaea]|nr:uncharacterized protein DS421_10g288170 [Arachis hypogaea]